MLAGEQAGDNDLDPVSVSASFGQAWPGVSVTATLLFLEHNHVNRKDRPMSDEIHLHRLVLVLLVAVMALGAGLGELGAVQQVLGAGRALVLAAV